MKNLYPIFFLLFATLSLQGQVELSGIINDYMEVTAIQDEVCKSIVTVQDAAAFAVGNSVVVMQMQGAIINEDNSANFGNITNLNGAGFYEINEIDSIWGQDIFLKYQIVNDYDVNGKVQLITMPVYENANIQNTLTASAWDGNIGGVVALKVNAQLLMNADIDVSGLGFRGGNTQTATTNNCTWIFQQDDFFYEFGNWRGAAKGEGIAAIITDKEFGKGAQANGGGGGNDHNSGGGGGANVTSGGMGGENFEPSTFGCQGAHPGEGGKGISNNQDRLFLGGGGGAGHDNNGVATNGVNGGGIVILIANDFIPAGFAIKANGDKTVDGGGDGAGGGGAGGTILLEVQNIMSTVNLETNGGDGGLIQNGGDRCHGPGGGGSGGRIVTNLMTGASFVAALNGGQAGMSINSSSCGNGTNGATNGQDGVLENLNNIILANEDFQLPQADFSFIKNGNTVTFSNQSQNADTYFWNFGDNMTDTSADPTHTYTQEGNYEVQLIISSACGMDTVTQIIALFAPPTAQFSLTEENGCAPFIVDFTNQSMGMVNTYSWTFEGGDPATSTDANPQVTYNSAGIFDVQLEVIGPGGNSIETKNDIINITPLVVPDFDFTINGSVVSFNNTSMNAASYIWDFGDGSPVNNEANPTYEYMTAGTYEVILLGISEFCDVSITQTIVLDFVDVEDLEKLGVKIFPNPTTDFVMIETVSNEDLDMKIFTVDGQEMTEFRKTFSQTVLLSLENLSSGVYILNLKKGGEVAKYRLVKM